MSRSKGDLMNLWVQAGGRRDKAGLAADIALAESGGQDDAVNDKNTNGTIDRGLWQINSIHGKQSTTDPLANAKAAVAISGNGANFRPWVTYNTGAYTKFKGPTKGGGSVSRETPSAASGTQSPQTVDVPDPEAASKATLKALLQRHGRGDSSIIRMGLLDPTPGTQTLPATASPNTSAPSTSGAGASGRANPSTRSVQGRANAISKQKLPYQWGGGHAAKVPAGTPLDCSGAVSKVLGINPMVASQFKSWGKAGRGKGITIYAKDSHVLMEINGHFWGTSASNPGGGAGWIPRSAISPAYLAGFTARHPDGG
jgi:hypothetical protein